MFRRLSLAILAGLWLFRAAAAEDQPYRWATIPFGGGGYVSGYLYHPKQKDVLYARTDVGGLYRFDFAARRWVQLFDRFRHADGELMGVLSIAVDPQDPAKLYSANGMYLGEWAHKGAILRSKDQGRTWQRTDLPIRIGGNADGRGSGERLVVDPKDGNRLFFASNQDGLWHSSDAGVTFRQISSPSKGYSLAAINPFTDEIYLGSSEGGLYVSRDHAKTFLRVEAVPGDVPQHIAFGKDGVVFVTFSGTSSRSAINPGNAERGSVFRRNAAGQWEDITPERPSEKLRFGYSGVDVGPDGTLAVTILDRWDGGNGIYLSRDGGAHWFGLKGQTRHEFSRYPWLRSQLDDPEQIGGWLSDVKINPFDRDQMIFTGTWFSRNLREAGTGKTLEIELWTDDLEESCITQLWSPVTGRWKILASMLDNAGAAWSDIAKGPDQGVFRPAKQGSNSVDYAALRPDFIVREADEAPTKGYYSEDGAKSWQAFRTSPYKAPPPGTWRSPGMIAVSAAATSLLWVPELDTAYYSVDKGESWIASAGWPKSDQPLRTISDKALDGVYYVFDRIGAIHISTDGGRSFRPIIAGLPKAEYWDKVQLAVVPGRVRDLWLAAPYGLLHSPGAGAPMTSLRGVSAAWSIGFGAPMVSGGYPAVYLWGVVDKREGLWRSDDQGESWVRINDDDHQYAFDHLAGDWQEPGLVYVGAGARGLFAGRPQR